MVGFFIYIYHIFQYNSYMIKNSIPKHNMGVSVSIPIERIRNDVRYRWILTVPSLDGYEQSFFVTMLYVTPLSYGQAVSSADPSLWRRSRVEWDPLKFTIFTPIGDNSNLDYFHEWFMCYDRQAKRTVKLQKVNPVGIPLEVWELGGSFITEMNHEIVMDRQMSEIEVTINFDCLNLIL